MTPRQLRAALRSHFADAGFAAVDARFVRHTSDLTHEVTLNAVRRLPGTVQIDHHVLAHGQTEPLLSEVLASHGFNTEFPRIWSAASVDGPLVIAQVLAIVQAFQTLADVAHFFSDRYRHDGAMPLPPEAPAPASAPAASARALSAAETSAALQRLGQAILHEGFTRVPGPPGFELWACDVEVEGFRHCAYLEANPTGTLAVLNTCALPVRVIADRFRSEGSRRALHAAPKRVLFAAGRPILLPLTVPFSGCADVRLALRAYLAGHPPHLLPR